MARSKSSSRWLQEHFDDEYVKKAQSEGYRSRAVYKLIEIDKKDKLLHHGMKVVDLGAAPGGWSQIVAKKVGVGTKTGGIVVAMDILQIDPISGVTVLQGDFREDSVLEQLQSIVGEQMGESKLDLVLSDMAPNLSGISEVDIPKTMLLVEMAHEFAKDNLKQGGNLLMKVFQGEGFDQLIKTLQQDFSLVITRKPKASRGRSREVYLLAKGFR
ncbi:MAG: 23S rRNA (uridine(2552)-2'-O)-methyltransferase RlmE [Thiotrichales bacterium]|nr:23S rRNA (uridine(2552)-2'-O)-methyltransferase RlmE [Thiotrichales bacterium]MBT3752909.1 23S rRNA (uridine(2552)-2'-O)-methyltransferase RlmE [Thiotrichales bacterium]MBT4151597.1 23S rRNA (uridine(2552)-2'-O)-methyltransferase RlmE [Thiotrichales bacterium]MBT6617028.1 23S rRNA (uridine(2552)-2'-O)-methyltransferase RlmE [Thiotrichales bacterium]MBT6809821.1 23S rRNA (uridine(2552)-2'-O)-methyltransferase RlmE [Thiotrichales bacterium]